MSIDLEVAGGAAVTIPPADIDAGIRAIVTGPPPVRRWPDLGAWLQAHGEPPRLIEVTGTWLVSRRSGSDHTRNAYAADLSRWFTWCAARGTHPTAARYTDADLYAAACREAGLAKATVGRHLAAVSSWYKYAIRAEVATVNPMENMERPRPPAISSTRGMSQRELAALLAHAKAYRSLGSPTAPPAMWRTYIQQLRATGDTGDVTVAAAGQWMAANGLTVQDPLGQQHAIGRAAHFLMRHGELERAGRGRYRETAQLAERIAQDDLEARRAYALLMTLAATASRIGAILAADAADVGSDAGYRTLDLRAKGDIRKRFVLPAPTVAAIEDYLDGRTTGPLFATATGNRMNGAAVGRLIRLIAKQAGIPQHAKLSPHSMRHTTATILLANGTELHIVQGLLGHARPETTQRYNHGRESLDLSPANRMAELIAAEMRILEAENE
jgi:site-specific recombinase XerD